MENYNSEFEDLYQELVKHSKDDEYSVMHYLHDEIIKTDIRDDDLVNLFAYLVTRTFEDLTEKTKETSRKISVATSKLSKEIDKSILEMIAFEFDINFSPEQVRLN